MSEKKYPKSYLSAEEREDLINSGADEHLLCVAESMAASEAGDDETGWAWLASTKLTASNLRKLKLWRGADFIRKWGFDTTNADIEMGAGWLDR